MATSRDESEARPAAHGDLEALRRWIGFGLNLDDERGRSYAAADARVEVASCGAAVWVFKGEKTGGGGTTRAEMRAEVTVRLVSWSDTRWETGPTSGPRLAVTRGRGTAQSAAAARIRARGRWAALPRPRSGPRCNTLKFTPFEI